MSTPDPRGAAEEARGIDNARDAGADVDLAVVGDPEHSGRRHRESAGEGCQDEPLALEDRPPDGTAGDEGEAIVAELDDDPGVAAAVDPGRRWEGDSGGREGRGQGGEEPVVTWASEETMTLWDDCMSLPDRMVKVRRHRSISLRYVDERGVVQVWERLPPSHAELLQHELDHLDGVLMTDRAEPGSLAITREHYLRERARFDAEVDAAIVATLG